MSYVKVETSVPRHQKFLSIGPAASWLWLCGLAYCQDGLTDGFIPTQAITTLGVTKPLPLVVRLVQAGLWHEESGGWRIHKYLDHNNSAAHIRKVQSERRAAGRKGGRPLTDSLRSINQIAFVLLKHDVKQNRNPSVSVPVAVSVRRDQKKQKRADAPRPPVENRQRIERLDAVIRQHRRRRSNETDDGRPAQRVIAALARHVVADHPDEDDDGELRELVKTACARANLRYDSLAVGAALEQALAQRRKRRAA